MNRYFVLNVIGSLMVNYIDNSLIYDICEENSKFMYSIDGSKSDLMVDNLMCTLFLFSVSLLAFV